MAALGQRILAMTAVALLLLGVNPLAAAIDDAAALGGVAVDASGAALPGVAVTLRPAAGSQGDVREQVTDSTGRFTFTDLEPGSYIVALSLPGFEETTIEVAHVPTSEELTAVLQVARLTETVIVRPEPERALSPVTPIGDVVIGHKALNQVPLVTERLEDALPLLPGIVRGPDGLLNMNGARADQSAFLMNGVNMTDPVTGHFAVRLPLEAIETMNVHGGVYSAAFGTATGGVTDVVIRPGLDAVDFQVQNFLPRLRFGDGGVRGLASFTPRVRIAGPIDPGRIWFSQAASYRFVRSRVGDLEPLGRSEQTVNSVTSVTQIDALVDTAHRLTATVVVFPSDIDNAGIDTLHPFDATPDLTQRGWTATISERAVLAGSMTLSTSVAVKQYDMDVAPKYDGVSVLTVSGARGTYFNRFDRDSTRYDAGSTLAVAIPDARGQHLIQAGGRLARTRYDGIDASGPVLLTRANGSPLRRFDYLGSPIVGATDVEVAGFVEDQWAARSWLTVHGGVRYAYERTAGQQGLAPGVDVSLRPLDDGRTIIKAGFGRLYDKLPLNAADFTRQQSRRITEYDEQGDVRLVTAISNRLDADGLQMPESSAWSVELDQLIAATLQARVGYRRTNGSRQLVVDPQMTDGALLLSSRGRSRSHQIEATVRRQFTNVSHVTASYVRSSTKGDLNDFVSLFGDLRDPVIRPNEYARQPFDVPNRLLVWGVMHLPRDVALAPTMEYRNGFPYTIVDERQNVSGGRNQGGRYPNLFTLDLAVTKDVRLTTARRARVGLQVFNLTYHFNPQDVQNNTASPSYRQFANSVNRQWRMKFTLLF